MDYLDSCLLSRGTPHVSPSVGLIKALQTLQQSTPLIRRLLLLPAHLALFFIPLNPTTSYSLLTISIPTLTTLLVLPIPPSVPLLIHPLLPLSSLLLNMLLGSIRSAALLMPLVIALFLLFAWAMNGDIFRGFHLLPSAPEEPRIAPFEARLWIFITAILLLVFSITMTISRAIVPIREGWDEDGARRWRGAIKEGDEWERVYGVTVARLARRRLGLAVQEMVRPVLSPIRNPRTSNGDGVSGGEEARHQREDLDPKVTPHRSAKARAVLVPINVLCLPLDIALLALHLAQVLRVFSLDHRTHYGLFEVRDWIAVMVVGLPCYLFERVGRLTDYESSTAIRS